MKDKWKDIWPDSDPRRPKKIIVNDVELPRTRWGTSVFVEKLSKGVVTDPSIRFDKRQNLIADSTAQALVSLGRIDDILSEYTAERRTSYLAPATAQNQARREAWLDFIAAHMNDVDVLAAPSDERRQLIRLKRKLREAGVWHPSTDKVIRDALRDLKRN